VPIDGQGVTGTVSNITFRNNVLHDSFNNDILKINNAASLITVTGNMFYNQGPSSISGDEHYRALRSPCTAAPPGSGSSGAAGHPGGDPRLLSSTFLRHAG
jgi:hypothetical protein